MKVISSNHSEAAGHKKNNSPLYGLIFVGALFLIGVIFAIVLFVTSKKGAYVQVRIGGEVTAEYSLNKNAVYTIESTTGGTNKLIIEDGQAWVEEASCPDQICVYMGKISLGNQSIICLPNLMSLEIVDEEHPSVMETD